jgi:hypothetical protein
MASRGYDGMALAAMAATDRQGGGGGGNEKICRWAVVVVVKCQS